MTTICTLEKIFPAMKSATDDEIQVMRDGMKMVTVRTDQTPLMELEYALNAAARGIVKKYTVIS